MTGDPLSSRGIVRGGLFWLAAIGATALCALVAVAAPIQIPLILLGLLAAALIGRRTGVMVLVIAMVPTLALIRRLASGDTGYTESDPLILLPLLLTLGVLLVSLGKPRTVTGADLTRALAIAAVLGVVVTVILRAEFSLDGLFYAGMVVIPLLLAVSFSTGRMPQVWGSVVSALPWLAIAVSVYAVIQFFMLPPWDRAWMISSGLTSIGHPYPEQVRVFGSAESPGPFAVFLGVCLTAGLCLTVTAKSGRSRLVGIVMAAAVTLPLILTGVRSALLGVAISVLVLVAIRATGFSRVVLVVFFAGSFWLLNRAISTFGGSSTILNTDRYSDFSNDTSLTARLELIQYIANAPQYLIGNPSAPPVDNLFLDVLVRYGLLSALAMFALFVVIFARALALLWRRQNEIAALCAMFVVVQSMFGNIFHALTGILVGVVIGTVMTKPPRPNQIVDLEQPGSVSHTSKGVAAVRKIPIT